MANKTVHLPLAGYGATLRKDNWWAGNVLTVTILLGFIGYATFRAAFEGHFYLHGDWPVYGVDYVPYITPFASPYIDTSFATAWHLPVMLTPAMLILAGPASFRFTCYYYRKAYYRAFAFDPPACAVGERNAHKYNGEKKLLVIQNFHRYALYAAILFLVFLWHDAVKGFIGWHNLGGGGFGGGVGSFVLLANVLLLSGYTFGCHSFRHLVGGSVNSYSTAPLGMLRHGIWKLCTKLNQKHMVWAWCSLFGVALTDVYVRMVLAGVIKDVRLF
jgi:hypothetical protein